MARRLTLDFLKTEAASGTILALAAVLALVVANSNWADGYFSALKSPVPLQIGDWSQTMTLSQWIKNGLMAIFFFVVGLEIKYEILRGELSNPRRLALPLAGALGGMIVPAVVYLAINTQPGGDPHGWSVPVATDIAFALAAFAIFARNLPSSLRIFLLTLAIVDDLGAVAIIAFVYTDELNYAALAGAGVALAFMALLRAIPKAPWTFYAALFLAVWGFTLESGVNTSLAGVAAAMTVPIEGRSGEEGVLKRFMHGLHPYVAYGILPLFAFAASGFSFAGMSLAALFAPVPLGVALGLFVGKQAGVLLFVWLAVVSGLARKPTGATWLETYGVAILCGIGFTMSLFLGALALPIDDQPLQDAVKLGVVSGSLLSLVWGAIVLTAAARTRARREALEEAVA